MSFGGEIPTEFSTIRGRTYPTIRQFTVFLENRVGQFGTLIRRFEGSPVPICALTITEATECALVRLVFSHPEQGREILERNGYAVFETDLIGVELGDEPHLFVRVCSALLQAELNIRQIYPLLVRPHGRPAVAMLVDNIETAQEILANGGFTMIREADLIGEE